jgi:hypothetical protein
VLLEEYIQTISKYRQISGSQGVGRGERLERHDGRLQFRGDGVGNRPGEFLANPLHFRALLGAQGADPERREDRKRDKARAAEEEEASSERCHANVDMVDIEVEL